MGARQLGLIVVVAGMATMPAHALIQAQIPGDVTPAWSKGIQPISSESYWNAVECGKLGGDRPACVFSA